MPPRSSPVRSRSATCQQGCSFHSNRKALRTVGCHSSHETPSGAPASSPAWDERLRPSNKNLTPIAHAVRSSDGGTFIPSISGLVPGVWCRLRRLSRRPSMQADATKHLLRALAGELSSPVGSSTCGGLIGGEMLKRRRMESLQTLASPFAPGPQRPVYDSVLISTCLF